MASTSRTGRLLAALGLCASACFAAQSHAQCVGYSINATGPGTFVAGTSDIGLHADDGTLAIALPFNVDFYGTSYSSVTASTNGNLQFASTSTAYTNNCLPTTTFAGPAILPFWDDQYTVTTGVGQGIFTGTTGTAPNRVFVIEWRTQFCCVTTAPVNDYEVKFYEGQSYFDIVYSTPMSDRSSATIGAQAGPNPTDAFVQYVCNTAGPAANTSLRFNCITAATSGACCNTLAGTCAISTPAACTGTGFQFRGLGTSCPSTCPTNGACCNATTGACLLVGSAGCTGAGNTYSGDGTVCNPSPCPAPGNDDCATVVSSNTPRIPAAGGTVSGTTLNATDDGGSGCGSGGHNDVYFLFTPTTTSSWTFALCGTTPSFDTILSIHSGCPADATTQLAGGCNDDSCGLLSSMTVAGLTANTQYIVRVSNYTAGTGGTFSLAVTAAQLGACCSSATGACTSSTTGATGCAAGTVYQGDNTSCTPVPCPIQACCNPNGACTVVGTDPCPSGTTAQGSGTTCAVNPCPQPPGASCATALTINLNTPTPGDLTANGGTSNISCSSGVRGTWYSFTAPATGSYVIDSMLTSGAGNPSIGVFTGDCSTQLACVNPCTGTDTQAVLTLNQGDVIHFRAGGCGDVQLTWSVTVSTTIVGACCNASTGACVQSNSGSAGCPSGTTYQGDNSSCTPTNPCPQPPPPANDDCAHAQALTLNVAATGTNATATGDGTEGPGGACYTTSPTTFNRAVWFTFTAPATDVFGITACGTSFDSVLSVFDGTCTAFGSELGCDDDTCDGVTPPGSGLASIIAPVPMTAGQTYLIRLAAWNVGTGGAYSIMVTGTAPTGGVCCRGATCNTTITSAAACTGSLIPGQTAGAAFVGTATACNTTGNTTSPCCYANYNKTGGISVQDIFDFLNDWFAGSPFANTGGSGAPGSLAVQNIFDFLNAWFAGGCS